MANSEDKKQSFLERAKDAHFSEVNNLQMNEGARETAEEILKRVETDRIKLKVNKVWIDKKYDNDNIEEQLKVRNRGQVWSDDLRADVTLVDKESGKEIDREKSLKIADIPKLTDRGTYMMGGTEFMFSNQSRLRPGVYTKRGSDGRVSSFFNVDKTIDFDRGYNANFRLHLDPESKQFTMTYGTKNVPLLSALRAVGVNDEDVKKSWGDEVYNANLKKVGEKDDHQQEKLYHAIMGKAPEGLSGAEMRKVIKERLFATELDPETTKLTLGKEYKQVDGDALIDASKKIMAVNKGDVEEDDRDSIVFKNHYGAADHVKENMLRNADKVVNNLKFKLDRTRQINKSLSSQTLNPFIKNVITSSKLSSPPTQTNLMTILDESSKTTIMGEGGVGSDRAVSDSSRNISNSDIGFLDPSHSPEGSGIGVTLHHTVGTVKIGNDIYGSFKDTKGNKISLRPIESFDKTIAFPDQYDDKMKPKSDKIKAIRKNKIVVVSPKEVDLVYNSHMNLFDMSANSIPFLDSLQGNRALTASKMQSQALTLKDRDKPLFKIVDEKGRSISEVLASQIALPKAKAPGEVIEVSDNRIVIKQDDGEKKVYQLYKDFPLNSESFITNEPLVKVGDKVKDGQVLADNNNTRDGQFALGANLNVAVMPYRGYNFEDSTIVSESAARKLTSLHNYDLKTKRSSGGVFSKDKFKAYYPNELNKENYDKLDKEGVIKLGQKVNRGDLVIAHLEKREPTADDLALGRLDKQLKRDMADTGVRWENDHVGIVTGVEKHGNQVVVNVRTEEQLKVADKLSGLHGNKHIVSKIVPDEEMPFNPRTGERIDITMSPIGVSNRINTSQLIEMAAGKIAKKTGNQYEWMNFSDTDNTSKVLEDLNNNGIPDREELIDPKSNTPFLNKVFTGTAHILKLEHKVDHKLSSRYREGYDSNEQPLSGGHSGSKNLGRMEMAALLARKGTENLKEVFNIKGQKNDDFWRAIETGNTPPPPKDSFAWNKFTSMLQGAGLNVEQKGKVFSLRPMVDKDIEDISAGELKRPFETFRKKDLAPMRSGLFDPSITGGMRGDNYSHFKLPEKTLNPSMVMATASLLDMPQSKIEDIMVGKHFVDEAGEIVPPGTKGAVSGGPAMEILLSKIDVNKEIKNGRKDAESITNPTALNKIHRKLRVLEGLKKQDLKPTDYLIENVLVVPPKYRPVSAMGTDGSVVVSDVNDLYQQMAMTSNIFGDLKKTLKDEIGNKDIENLQMKDVRAALFKDANALAGYSDPTSYLHRLHNRKGFVSLIDAGKDKQTKSGYFQRKVMQRKQDLVGRSTIILNPELGGDELGVPRVMAKKIFQPFVMQKMVSWGYKPLEAAEHIEKDSSVANRALDVAAQERLIIANRAPTLHRYNMTAFKPKLVDGKAIQVPSTVIGRNFGGDFDGDTFQLHVPIGQKALKEAETMMPSGGMFKEGWGSILNAPGMDMTIGAYLASKGDGGKVTKLSYPSLEAAQEAHRNNKIEMSDTITVRGKKSTYIMHEINAILPPSHQKWDAILSQKEAEKWIGEVSHDLGGRIGLSLADKLKTVGNDYSTRYGYTLGLTDTLVEKDLRDKVLKEAEKKSKSGKPEDIINAYSEAKSTLEELVKEKHGDKTMLGIGVKSGGSKGIGNTLAITAMPGILSDAQGNAMAIPVIRSYSEGLDTGSYIVAAHGARSGNIQKSVSSFKPGWLTKDLVNSIYSVNINNENPVDDEGIEYDVDDSKGIARRYLARDVKDSKGRVIAERNTLIDSEVVNKFRKAKIKSVFVQSPLTDPTPGDGISSYSYGEDYSGQKHKRGDAIGVISAHTITEPSLNMAMKAFHTGGAFSGKKKAAGTRFDALDRLFRFNQNIPNKAMVSPIDGTVKSIKPSDVGGYNVTVNGADGEEVIYIEAGNEPAVKVGSKVEAGQKLDSGVMSAHDVLKHKGMRETQKFLVKEIYDLNDQGLDKRDIETLVRGITNTTKVVNPGTFREFVPGDVAPLTTVEYMNRNRIKTIEVSDAVGARLNKQYGKYPKGTVVNSEIQNDLDKGGHDNVEVELPEITHQPFLTPTGIGAKAGTSEDWVARLAHNRIRDVLQMGGSMGWQTDVSDEQLSHPISKFVTGVFK